MYLLVFFYSIWNFLNKIILIFFSLQAWPSNAWDAERRAARRSGEHVFGDSQEQQLGRPLWGDLTVSQKHFDVHWPMFSTHFTSLKKVKFQLSSRYYFILQFNYIHTESKPLCKVDYTCIWRDDLMTVVHYSELLIQQDYNYRQSHCLLRRTCWSRSVHTYSIW